MVFLLADYDFGGLLALTQYVKARREVVGRHLYAFDGEIFFFSRRVVD